MEKYAVSRFTSPHLSVDCIGLNHGALTLSLAHGEYAINFESESADDGLYERLKSLRRSDSVLWAKETELVEALDKIGAIKDTALKQVDAGFWREVDKLKYKYQTLPLKSDAAFIQGLIKQLLLNGFNFKIEKYFQLPFAQQLAHIYLHYLKSFSPLAYCIISYIITADVQSLSVENIAYRDEMGSLLENHSVSLRQTKQQVSAFLQLIEDHLHNKGKFRIREHVVNSNIRTGNNLVLEAEEYIAAALSSEGNNPLVEWVQSQNMDLYAAQKWYLSQYHVTKRYVSTITPVLSKNIQETLKNKLFRYYQEEVGHEKYEYQNCLGLGLSPGDIECDEPLPYHTLFMDLLTYVSSLDTLAYVFCLYLVEGLDDESESIGQLIYDHTLVHAKLDMIGNEHAEANEHHQHRGIPRVFGADLGNFSIGQASQAFSLLRLLLEVSQRASDALCLQMKEGINGD